MDPQRKEIRKDIKNMLKTYAFSDSMLDVITEYAIKFESIPPFGFYLVKEEDLLRCIAENKTYDDLFIDPNIIVWQAPTHMWVLFLCFMKEAICIGIKYLKL